MKTKQAKGVTIMTTRENKPKGSLHYINDADGVGIDMYFGYQRVGDIGEPTVALFHKDLLILIPKPVLKKAFEDGWDLEGATDMYQIPTIG